MKVGGMDEWEVDLGELSGRSWCDKCSKYIVCMQEILKIPIRYNIRNENGYD